MKRLLAISPILLFLGIIEPLVLGDTTHEQVVREINALDQQSGCHLAIRKIFDGDTDRGMEAKLYNCAQGVQRIEIIFGLSRKDLIFRYLLVNQRAVKTEVLEQKYQSTPDADPDFKNPLPPTSRGILYFDGLRLISIISAENLNISEKNKNAKAVAFVNLVNAVRTALMSSDPHPEFESISFLTGIFGNG
jgi:hypothetical protein